MALGSQNDHRLILVAMVVAQELGHCLLITCLINCSTDQLLWLQQLNLRPHLFGQAASPPV